MTNLYLHTCSSFHEFGAQNMHCRYTNGSSVVGAEMILAICGIKMKTPVAHI